MNQLAPADIGPRGRLDRFLPGTEDHAEDAGFKISLGDLRAMLWRQRKFLVLITLGVVLLGLALTMLMTPRYQALASVRIDNESVKIVEGQDLDPVVAIGDTSRYLNTQTQIVASRSLAARVNAALRLDRDTGFITAMGGKLPDGSLSARDRDSARREAVLQLLQKNVEMKITPDSRIGGIGFTSRDPALAARIANSYAANYIEQNVQTRYDTNAYARKVLTEQVAEAQAQLQATERRAIDYARKYRLIDTGDAASGADDGKGGTSRDSGTARSITTASLIQLNENFIDARSQRIAAEAQWRAAQGSHGYDLPEGRTNGAVQGLLNARADQAARLSELRARYKDGNPEVQEAAAKLRETERQLDAVGRSIKGSIQSEYRAAIGREQALSAARERVADATLAEQDRRVALNLIARDAETQRRQLNDMLTRLNQIASASDITTNNLSLLDAARVPTDPVSPNLRKNMVAALLAGLALAFLVAFGREALDDTLRSPDDAEKKLGLPLLGTTPYVPETTMQDAEERNGELSEAYYSIRATIDYASAGAVKKTLLVTSSQPSEGKSTTAIAIARDFARIGRKVLLIDGDLRNPSLHRSFGLSREIGFMNVLMNTAPIEQARVQSDLPNLHLLPLGPIPPNPVQILSSGLIQEFLGKMREQYDIIVVDSAPVMGLADAPMLSRMADYVVLIVEANRAHFGQAKSAVRRLQDAGANMLGIVMTKFRFREAGYSYDYHYSYYSYRSKATNEKSSA